jgi:DNA-binding helix-hairpin-helix protein with protein kinase domain
MRPQLVTSKGEPLQLARELGRGGEGAVFEVANHADLVAKLYHDIPEPNKAAKLNAMASGCTDRLSRIAAWPTDTVREASSGLTRGFLMKRVARQKDIHVLYGPKTRLRDYPEATYRFLVHVAANLARAFAVIHEHRHVVGDVNQGGVCVSAQGTVTLVDCDSFQISADGKTYACDVGIPIYQPPEFQHVHNFNGLPRAPNHDAFGLAVLIFQTLFLARHPFAGAYQGSDEMPIERAIREFRFAYGRDASRRLMKQPPGSLGLGAAPPQVAEFFERAFLEVGARGKRPTAAEWIGALDGFAADLKGCSRNPGHAHASSLHQCPLCEIECRIGVLLFLPPRSASVAAPTVNLEELWRDLVRTLDSVNIPAASSIPQPQPPPPPPAVVEFKRAKSRSAAITWLGVLASLLFAAVVHPAALLGILIFPLIARASAGDPPPELSNLNGRLKSARHRFEAAVHQLERERTVNQLPQMHARANQLYRSLQEHPRKRVERLRRVEQTRRERQLSRFLDQFEVTDCRIKGVSRNRMLQLASYGIETADDVTEEKLEALRAARCGFGPKRTAQLMGWRRALETRFRPSDTDSADVQERFRVERELQIEHAKEIAELQRIAEHIRAQAGPLRARINAISHEIDEARRELGAVLSVSNAFGKAA